MADLLRTMGNLGAHASEYEISEDEADSIDNFFNAMLEYVYIAPSKIQNLKNTLNNKK